MNELIVLLDGSVAGTVHRKGDRLEFRYDADWRQRADAYPLSMSMPLAAEIHPHATINAYIWGLLPDNEMILDRWSKQFQVSARNAFALIGAVGEDCAGAVQFVRPERLEPLRAGDADEIAWIDEAGVAERLRSTLRDNGTGRTAADNGQFSLAGAQPKTALLRADGRWGVPAGRVPTTHILKPPSAALPGHAENEHFCLELARRVGLRTALSEVLHFDGQPAIVVERYDRLSDDSGGFMRVHQEDMCQALGKLPTQKYQNEGGPSPADIMALIQRTVIGRQGVVAAALSGADRDPRLFVDALIYNWLIGGTDAHAKNYSLLIGARGRVRLAPLYDIASAYAFADLAPQRMKLAMKIDDYYHVERLHLRHWLRWAGAVKLDGDRLAERIKELAQGVIDNIPVVADDMRTNGVGHPAIDRLADLLPRRAASILAM